MGILYFLVAKEGDAKTKKYLDKLNRGKCIQRKVGDETKLLYPCPAGFHDVDIAFMAAARRKPELKLEAYEEDAECTDGTSLQPYEPHVKHPRRSKTVTPYIVRRSHRSR